MIRWMVFCVLVLLLAACTGNPLPAASATPAQDLTYSTDTPAPTRTLTETPEATPTLTEQPPSPTPTPSPPAPIQYHISAELDYGWRVVTASQKVTIPHPSNQPLNEIVLIVQPNWYPDTFRLDEITWIDHTPIQNYVLDGIRLTIALSEPWELGTSIELVLTFTLNLPTLDRGEQFGPNPFGYSSRQVNLTDWHPYVPPFKAGEWLVHEPWYYGEHLVYPTANFDVELRLTNAPDNTVIAASALDKGQDGVHLYQIDQARNFVLSISPDYRVFREDVDGVTLLGYSFPFDKMAAEAAFAATVDSYRLYNRIFGPYPHESLSMVQADFLHGMEYDGLYFLSKALYNTYEDTPASYLVAIAVHETAHQWWFGLVANDQALEPWLDEAICTFTERLYYENRYPEALQWWLEYRVAYYEPKGRVDISIYDADGYRTYRDAVYLNGMNFLSELRDLVGPEVFMHFLRDYLVRNTNEITTGSEFFSILSEHTDVDLSQIKEKYFRNP